MSTASSKSGSESESDIEMQTHLPRKIMNKTPLSPQDHLLKERKKLPIKDMVHATLKELNTRKGVSLYAIKKHMVEKYNADTEKLNFYIKKCIKTGVDAGDIIQTKGIGASGSFKLPSEKKGVKIPKKKKITKNDQPKKEKAETNKKTKEEKSKTEKKVTKKKLESKEKVIQDKEVKVPKIKKTKEPSKEKVAKESKKDKLTKKGTKTKSKTKNEEKSPTKKKFTMKRKSIGSIIKPPKMKPKKHEQK